MGWERGSVESEEGSMLEGPTVEGVGGWVERWGGAVVWVGLVGGWVVVVSVVPGGILHGQYRSKRRLNGHLAVITGGGDSSVCMCSTIQKT